MLERIRIVLVETVHSGNIGGVARAMKNMGLRDLRLVAPQRFPDPEASWRAVSAADVLDGAQVVATLDEAIADCALVVATSARERTIPWPVVTPRDCAPELLAVAAAGQPVAVLFGREDYGLSTADLQRCNYHVSIPTDSAYSSLNLAMAVQLIAYELFLAAIARGPQPAAPVWDRPLASNAELEYLYAHLERTAVAVGFLDPARPRQMMPRMRRLFARARLDVMELNILRGILAAVDRRLEPPPEKP